MSMAVVNSLTLETEINSLVISLIVHYFYKQFTLMPTDNESMDNDDAAANHK